MTGRLDALRAGIATLRRPVGPALRPSRRDWIVDTLVALLVAVVISERSGRTPNLEDPTGQLLTQDPAARSVGMTIAFLVALPLVARRRYPLAAFWLVMLGFHFGHDIAAFDPAMTVLAGVIAAYSAVMHSPYPVLAVSSGLVGAVILLADLRADMYAVRPGMLSLGILVPAALALTTILHLEAAGPRPARRAACGG